jgi:hypothetical protein
MDDFEKIEAEVLTAMRYTLTNEQFHLVYQDRDVKIADLNNTLNPTDGTRENLLLALRNKIKLISPQ